MHPSRNRMPEALCLLAVLAGCALEWGDRDKQRGDLDAGHDAAVEPSPSSDAAAPDAQVSRDAAPDTGPNDGPEAGPPSPSDLCFSDPACGSMLWRADFEGKPENTVLNTSTDTSSASADAFLGWRDDSLRLTVTKRQPSVLLSSGQALLAKGIPGAPKAAPDLEIGRFDSPMIGEGNGADVLLVGFDAQFDAKLGAVPKASVVFRTNNGSSEVKLADLVLPQREPVRITIVLNRSHHDVVLPDFDADGQLDADREVLAPDHALAFFRDLTGAYAILKAGADAADAIAVPAAAYSGLSWQFEHDGESNWAIYDRFVAVNHPAFALDGEKVMELGPRLAPLWQANWDTYALGTELTVANHAKSAVDECFEGWRSDSMRFTVVAPPQGSGFVSAQVLKAEGLAGSPKGNNPEFVVGRFLPPACGQGSGRDVLILGFDGRFTSATAQVVRTSVVARSDQAVVSNTTLPTLTLPADELLHVTLALNCSDSPLALPDFNANQLNDQDTEVLPPNHLTAFVRKVAGEYQVLKKFGNDPTSVAVDDLPYHGFWWQFTHNSGDSTAYYDRFFTVNDPRFRVAGVPVMELKPDAR
ncbi:MAG: hypothetical protein QM778_12185 [Myxococcales bacterium]